MGETQEVETPRRPTLSEVLPTIPMTGPQEGNQASLLRVEGETEPIESLRERPHHATSILLFLKDEHEVVRVADNLGTTLEQWHYLLDVPPVEDRVEIDVRQGCHADIYGPECRRSAGYRRQSPTLRLSTLLRPRGASELDVPTVQVGTRTRSHRSPPRRHSPAPL